MQATQHPASATARIPHVAAAGIVLAIAASFAVGAVVGRVVTLPVAGPQAAVKGASVEGAASAEQQSLLDFRAGERGDKPAGGPAGLAGRSPAGPNSNHVPGGGP
jgi:hypothetical protein